MILDGDTTLNAEDLRSLLADDKLYDALALLWRDLSVRGFLQQEENRYRSDKEDHESQYKQALSLLLETSHLTFANRLPLDRPLVLLQSLDEALAVRHGAQNAALPQVAVGDRRYLIIPRPLSRTHAAAHAEKAGSLQGWLKYHWLIPVQPSADERLEVSIAPAPDELRTRTAALLERGEVRIYVAQFADGVVPVWRDQTKDWYADTLSDTEKRWESVLQVLQAASAKPKPADLLVFPELSLCLRLRSRLQAWLDDNPHHPFTLILPGSFHQEIVGKPYNCAELLDAAGQVVLQHRKFTAYGSKDQAEAIDLGKTIRLLATPLGMVATPICLDLCDERLGALWQTIGAEWLLTPSFGDRHTISAHQRRAKELYRAHASVTAVANQHPDGLEQDAGFVCHNGETKDFAGIPVAVAVNRQKH